MPTTYVGVMRASSVPSTARRVGTGRLSAYAISGAAAHSAMTGTDAGRAYGRTRTTSARLSSSRARDSVVRAASDELILTTSGFRGEPPLSSLQGHLEGARSVPGANLEVVLDRRCAIAHAPRAARPGDAVVVLGRGALTDLTADPRGVPRPFDDRAVVRELLRTR